MTKKAYSDFLIYLFFFFSILSALSWLLLDQKALNYFIEFYPNLSKNILIVMVDKLWVSYVILSLLFLTMSILFIVSRLISNARLQDWSRSIYNLFRVYFILLLIGFFMTYALKIIIGRPRPSTYLAYSDIGNNFFSLKDAYHSFPSGHATVLASFVFSLIIFFKIWQKGYIVLFVTLMLLLFATTRLVLLKHFPSDLFAGFASATLASIIYLYFYERIKKHRNV